VTPDQTAYYVDLMKKVRETPDWKEFMEKGAFNRPP
jgi:putative tricarboxylic transport membrane protein